VSIHDELVNARHALDDLVRSVGRLQISLGNSLYIRRVREDVDHLREDLELWGQSTAAWQPVPGPMQSEVRPAPRGAGCPP